MLKAVGRLLALLTVPLLTTLWAKNVFIFPYTPSSSNVAVYNGDPLSSSPISTWAVGPYLSFVTSNTAGTKYYFGTSSSAPQARVYVVDGATGSALKQLNFTGTMTYMKLAPDGQRLIVWAGGLHVIDTNADVEITPAIPDIGPAIQDGVSITPDGTRVLVLVSLGNSGGRLYAVDLGTNTLISTSVSIPADVKAVTVAPSGLAYVSAFGGVYEINPQTLTILNTITTGTGTPAAVAFTPDGKLGIASNLTAQNGTSLYVFDLATKSVKATGTSMQFFDTIIPVGNTRAIGFTSGNQSIFDIPLTAPNSMSVPNWGAINFNGTVRGITASDEVPPKYVYALMLGVMYRLDVTAGIVSGQTSVAIQQAYHLETAGPASLNSVAALLAYNDTQTLTLGGTPFNLVARALDSAGRPVGGATVTFTTGNASVGVNSPNAVTNADGYAQTAVTVPAASGTYTVTGQAGSASRTFTISVGTNTGGGGGGGGTVSAGLSILSGQGQIVPQFNGTYLDGYEHLVVQLLDASGNPIPSAALTWTVRSGAGNIALTSTVTDTNGTSTNDFSAGYVSEAGSISQVAVDVSDGNGHTVTYNLTVIGNTPGTNQLAGVLADIITPADRIFTGGAGATQDGGLKLRIYTSWGAPLQNVALKIASPGDPAQQPTASCQGGYALSDVNGYATCNVVYGPKIGDAQVAVKFGGTYTYSGFNLHVNVGPPTQIVPITPASLSGNPGQNLGFNALGIEVRDAGGNKIPDVPLTWTVVTPGTVTLTNAFTRTNASGQGYATPTLGSIPGAATVKVTAGSGDNVVTFSFTLTVNVQLGGLLYVSGNNQSALVGTTFLQPLIVKVTNVANQPLQNITVNWAITSGVGSLNTPGTTMTDINGNASVNVTAGSNQGPIVVTASAGSLAAVNFTLTAIPPGPVFTAQQVVNYASKQPGVTPGGIAMITGNNLAIGITGSVVANNGFPGRWPLTLNGVMVKFGSYQAPIYAVSNVNNVQSVVVQVPFELPVGTTTVTITLSGGTGSASGVQVKSVQPGLFETVDPTSGAHFATLARPDGSLVTTDNPAIHGEILRMFVTGIGQTSPVTGTNEVGIPDQSVIVDLIAGVAGGGAIVTQTEYATGAIGVYIISFQLPPETKPSLNVPVSLAAQKPDGSYEYSNTSVIASVI